MRNIVDLPQVGESVTEGVIGKWLVTPGQPIKRYDPLVEVVTDKVNMEIPSPVAGVFICALVNEGDTVPMGSPICEIEDEKEEVSSSKFEFLNDVRSVGPTGSGERGEGRPDVLQEVPTQQSFEPTDPPTTPNNTVNRRDVISPLVAKIANQYNINLSEVNGSGIGGRITKKDLEQYLSSNDLPRVPTLENTNVQISSIPLTPIRKTIADHMSRSSAEIPSAWSMVELDVTKLVDIRSKLKISFEQTHDVPLTFMPFWVHIVGKALRANLHLNGRWSQDQIIINNEINLGIAVSTKEGLIVPVIKKADELNIPDIAIELDRLVKCAKTNTLELQDVQDGTFTLNNTGALGSIASVPIINYPQAAIVTTEAIVKRPVVLQNESISIRSMMNMCISFDHRICDGAEASRFLSLVKTLTEELSEQTLNL